MQFAIELECEVDGRWIAEVPDLPGVLAYGQTRPEALARVEALALRVLAERLEQGEATAELFSVTFRAA
jgi:predicted RNase H-like HicB family nuclease